MNLEVLLKLDLIYYAESGILCSIKVRCFCVRQLLAAMLKNGEDASYIHLQYRQAVSESNSGPESGKRCCESVRCFVQSLISPWATSGNVLSPTLPETHRIPGSEQIESQDAGPVGCQWDMTKGM